MLHTLGVHASPNAYIVQSRLYTQMSACYNDDDWPQEVRVKSPRDLKIVLTTWVKR